MKAASECCYVSVLDGKCSWCGEQAEATTARDALWRELDALLCDWDAPSKLATYDLHETIAKMRCFIKGREDDYDDIGRVSDIYDGGYVSICVDDDLEIDPQYGDRVFLRRAVSSEDVHREATE